MKQEQIYICTENDHNKRLDVIISLAFKFSRHYSEQIIKKGFILINNSQIIKKNTKVFSGNEISLKIPDKLEINKKLLIEPQLIFEHEDFIVVNKPPGLNTHPTHVFDEQPSLVDWIEQNNFWNDKKDLKNNLLGINRCGIVHRLDKDTSGLIIIAKNLTSLQFIKKLFEERQVKKTYYVIVTGKLKKQKDKISYSIMRDPLNPTKMTWSLAQGRKAETEYEVIKEYDDYTFIKCFPATGRTHQIRVHMTAVGNPVLGDILYGKSSKKISRQALHAKKLEFTYKNESYIFIAEIPKEIKNLID